MRKFGTTLALAIAVASTTVAHEARAAGPAGAASNPGAPVACSAVSPPHRVALVELFTSEGCSSCPPADRWLASLAQRGYGPERAVALSLHVGYWDYIGWKDPYADRVFTERQQHYARARGSKTVYTPQVVLDGRDFPGWRSNGEFAKAVAAINAQPAAVRLELAAQSDPETRSARVTIGVTSAAGASDGPLAIQVALFESRLASRVTRGENAGATLRHERVVRRWSAPISADPGTAPITVRFDLPADLVVGNAGVVAFVQQESGRVTQAAACELR